MKFTFFLFLIVSLPVLAQSKKKQIEALNKRLDSLSVIITSERKTILESNKTIEELNEKISSLENSSKQLNETILDLKQELQIRNSELTSIQSLLKSKTDSIKLLVEELEELQELQEYETVTIGNQVWMTKNLDVATFRNGDPILHAKTDKEWDLAGDNKRPAWCFYNNDPANGVKYGKLYNWYAVNDQRGLAPVGYHVPSDAEWKLLTNYLGDDACTSMKSTSGWSENGNGTNSSGFSGLPGGIRSNQPGASQNEYGFYFDGVGGSGYWWSSTRIEYNSIPNGICFYDVADGISLYTCSNSPMGMFREHTAMGVSVRCLKD